METNSDAKSRLETVLRLTQLKQGEFAKQIGVTAATISHVMSNTGRHASISENLVDKILAAFPEIGLSREWLLYGVESDESLEDGSQLGFDFDNPHDPVSNATENSVSAKNTIVKPAPVSTDHNKKESVQPKSQPYDSETQDSNIHSVGEPSDVTTMLHYDSDGKVVAPSERRQVSKIVMFYTDGTFSVYTPNYDH